MYGIPLYIGPRVRGVARLAAVLYAASSLGGCGTASVKSAAVGNCLTGPAVYVEQPEGHPRVHVNLEVEVACSAPHPFSLSEVETSGDSSVIGIEQGGVDTCLHKILKARGEKCSLEMFFDPRNAAGPYNTYVTFQYAGENNTYTTRIDGKISKPLG